MKQILEFLEEVCNVCQWYYISNIVKMTVNLY